MKQKILLIAICSLLVVMGCSHKFSFNNPVDPVIPPAAPKLSSPTDTATGISISPIFTWTASEGATSYTLQVSPNAACTSFVHNQSGIVATTDTVAGLSFSTNYYWRVRADKKDNSSDWTSIWSFTTTSATAPTVVTGSATSVTGTTAQLNGTVNPKGIATTYYFQHGLTTAYGSVTATQSAGSGSIAVAESVSIGSLTAGTVYHYRLAATNTGGTSYGNDGTFTTVPAAPVLLIPANNDTGIAASPTLSWNAASGAASYTLQVSISNTFGSFVYNQSGLTGTSQAISGLDTATIYYWRVNAANTSGTSGWSSVWQFKTASGPSTNIVWISIPVGNFTMGSLPGDPYVAGQEQPQHTVYLDAYQISKYEITNSQYKVFIDAGGYSNSAYWTTDGWNWKTANGITEPAYWSAGTYNSGMGFPNHPVVGVCWYEAYAFCNWAGGHLPTEAQWEKAARGTDARYYPWGSVWDASKCNSSFNTVPDTFASSSPVGYFPTGASSYGVYDISGNVWELCNDWYGSAYYSDPGANTNPAGPTTGTDRVRRGGGFQGGDIGSTCRVAYRDFVSPVNRNNGYYGFRIARGIPITPFLISPANGATSIATSPTLSWKPSSSAASYALQVSTDSLFGSYAYNQSGITAASQAVSGLTAGTKYYWRVNASNGYGTSGWSIVWNFTTAGSVSIEWISIPAGNFRMGSLPGDPYARADEQPQHTVYLDAYQISKYEITNSQYKVFMDAGGYSNSAYWTTDGWTWRTTNSITEPLFWTSGQYNSGVGFPNHPVIDVSWYEAYAFCQWAGCRLPTEAQLEKAARGTDSSNYWPWGSTWDGAKCNISFNTAPDTFAYSSPVGFFSAGQSPYGVYDMAGNAWEWCNDWYGSAYYSDPGANTNPAGPTTGTSRVFRCGSWDGIDDNARTAFRHNMTPDYRSFGIGLRPAK